MDSRQMEHRKLVKLLADNGYVIGTNGSILVKDSGGLGMYLGKVDLPNQRLQDLVPQPFCNSKRKE